MLLPGELDSSEEMYKAYYEFFLKYKVSTSYLPTYSYANLDEYVKVIQEYAVRDEVASYNIYTKGELYSGTEYDGWGIDAAYFEETLEAILSACTAEEDLLAKAYVYVSSIDEPRTTADYNRVMHVDKIISDAKTKLAEKYEASGFFRSYIPVGRSKIFGLFNEVRLTYGYAQGKNSTGSGVTYDGTYQTTHNLEIGFAPGVTAFITDFAAAEVSMGIMGFDFKWVDQKTNQVETGKRRTSSGNFKINLFSINIGMTFYL